MPSFFGAVTGKSSATLFEIRLDNEVIVIRGSENEASSQLLKGVVVLCLPAALKIEDVHLRMTGQLRVAWTDQRSTPAGVSNNRLDKTTEIFNHKWPPFVGGGAPGSNSKGCILPSGNYEWPFEIVIPGSFAESVEGLQESHIKYRLKATVARGKLAYDLHSFKPVRIIRTLDPSALELAHAMTVENIWPNKIEYQIIIPTKAIVFGSAIDIEMKFTSLLKGLKIGKINCQLLEVQELSLPATSQHMERNHKSTRDVKQWKVDLEEDNYQDMINEDGQDGYVMSKRLPLPKTLKDCVQDVDVHGIKIRHKVKFNIALHNPDGHISELRATLPVTIFISPNMPLNEDGQLVDQTPMSTQSRDMGQHAPPLYADRHLDQLYADFDNTGIMTPAPQSGMNTPFNGLSRAGSHENLASLNGVANLNGAVAPAALQSRLQDLDLNAMSRNSSFRRLNGSGHNTPGHSLVEGEPGYFDNNNTDSSSNPLSRRTSEEEHSRRSGLTSGQQTPAEHLDFAELGDLTKVPSYRTAVKAPTRGMSYSDALPDYNTAISAPPSPERGFSIPGTPQERRNPFLGMGFTPINSPAPSVVHGGDRMPLHVRQNRGRS
ncbi:probable ROD1-O-dinitrobenzene,calcium and zinc resistance protein [Rhynchosporium agropyri]|uniref:Probable ROD1-O-dinitrobenzene,calcium and zinc resistance protein n=1 Tax=Rhynchosporium agropyri TaxID=914238 RepID=A0A1E1K3U3_9HELO|nr:probable ROD1-O-dinitrobenzene,calcium and zinc resistance protein [Rhynchosporium agropyri]